MSRLLTIQIAQNAFAAACMMFALGTVGTFGATTQPASNQSSQPSDAERVRITTDIIQDCMAHREVTEGDGNIRQRLTACVNARLAKEGKPWRWTAGPADITIEKK